MEKAFTTSKMPLMHIYGRWPTPHTALAAGESFPQFSLLFLLQFFFFSVHACALTFPFNLIDDFSYSEKAWQCDQSIYFGGVYVGQHIYQYIHTFRLSTGNMHTHFSRIHNHSLAHTIYLSTCISRGASDQNSSIIYYNAHGFSTPPPPPHSLSRCALLPIFSTSSIPKISFQSITLNV